MNGMMKKCSECKFFVKEYGDYGQCRRFPPTNPSISKYGYNFPIVDKDSWCGEFKEINY